MWWFILTFLLGLAVGRKKFLPAALLQHPSWVITPCLALLLFFLGMQVGTKPAILRHLGILGVQGLVITLCTMAGSGLIAAACSIWLFRNRSVPSTEGDDSQ